MHRIDTESRALDLFGPGKDGYTEGDPLQGVAATQTSAAHLNALQEELCNLVEGAGFSLEKHDNTQLLKVVMRLARPYVDVLNWFEIPKRFVCRDICTPLSGSCWCLVGQAGNKAEIWCTKKSTFEKPSWSRASVLTGGPVPGSSVEADVDVFNAVATDGYRWLALASKAGEDVHRVFVAEGFPSRFTELEDTPLEVPASAPIEALARASTGWVAYGGWGLWVAVGQHGDDSFLATSQDAVESTRRDFPSAELLASVASANGVWLVGDAAGGLYGSLRA